MKPICYLDIDGVLYHYLGSRKNKTAKERVVSYVEIRPYVCSLIETLVKGGFELRLLTANPEGGKALLKAVKHSNLAGTWMDKLEETVSVYHNRGEHTGIEEAIYIPSLKKYVRVRPCLDKLGYIDFGRRFIWIEDGISTVSQMVLKKLGLEKNYCYVNSRPRDELIKTIRWVKRHPYYTKPRKK